MCLAKYSLIIPPLVAIKISWFSIINHHSGIFYLRSKNSPVFSSSFVLHVCISSAMLLQDIDIERKHLVEWVLKSHNPMALYKLWLSKPLPSQYITFISLWVGSSLNLLLCLLKCSAITNNELGRNVGFVWKKLIKRMRLLWRGSRVSDAPSLMGLKAGGWAEPGLWMSSWRTWEKAQDNSLVFTTRLGLCPNLNYFLLGGLFWLLFSRCF